MNKIDNKPAESTSSPMAVKAAQHLRWSRLCAATHDESVAEVIDRALAPGLDWNRRAREAMRLLADHAKGADPNVSLYIDPRGPIIASFNALLAEEQST